jgi:hypothetical protein
VEAALQAKVTRTVEQDVVIDEGPYAGETLSNCTWIMSGTAPPVVSVSIIRAPRTAQEREEGLSQLQGAVDTLRQKGWTIQSSSTGGALRTRGVPPASEARARPFTGCIMEKAGLAFSVTVVGPAEVTAQQVAALAGRVASRLP